MKKEEDSFLLEELWIVMKKKGHLSESDLIGICQKTHIPFSRVFSVATFYSLLDLQKKGRHIIRVCNSLSCHVNGSKRITALLEKILRVKLGETTKDKRITLEKTACIGCCDEGPAMLVDSRAYTRLSEQKIKAIVRKLK